MKQLVYGIERVELAAATIRRTPGVFLRIRANMLRCAKPCITSQRQHF